MPVPAEATETMNQILAGHFGVNRSSVAPDEYRVRLWHDQPDGDTPAEADWPGYTPPLWSSDDWLTPDGGEVLSDGLVDMGTPTDVGTDADRYWALHDASTNDLCYWGPLSPSLTVAESVNPVRIRLTVPYGGRND